MYFILTYVSLSLSLSPSPCLSLLLDEPTNHLDFPAVHWLSEYLKNFSSTLVTVSHDRNFLNTVSTDIIDLAENSLHYYRGDYNNFVRVRDESLKTRRHEYEVQQKKITELKTYIEQAAKSDNPATANSAKSRQILLDKMELIPEPPEVKELKFHFPIPGKLDHALLEINNMEFGYGLKSQEQLEEEEEEEEDMTEEQVETKRKLQEEQDFKAGIRKDSTAYGKYLLRNVNLNMDMESRVGLLGVNGAGRNHHTEDTDTQRDDRQQH